MGLFDEVNAQLDKTVRQPMTITKKQTSTTSVPEAVDLGYSEGKVISATYLYTDMLNSSGLAAAADKEAAAQTFRAFLNVSTKIIRNLEGHIRSFDGDRVMGVFTGPNKEDRAIKSAMRIKWAVDTIVTPALHQEIPALQKVGWTLSQSSGIATGDALLARAGFRGSDDMISIGAAPNLAAKLSDMRDDGTKAGYVTRIGQGTYNRLSDSHKFSNGTSMWEGPYSLSMGDGSYSYYRSSYYWSFS
ncbi:adenylate/guanylate cyclase domain-containing protein [Corynebacterium sp. A21]|uniref:adenylate/guanylate cyclase domain-containing protein n=1 Tax=Corynebacterium sp. A21 TaxID=3457318 RepID=UPI003FD3E5CD